MPRDAGENGNILGIAHAALGQGRIGSVLTHLSGVLAGGDEQLRCVLGLLLQRFYGGHRLWEHDFRGPPLAHGHCEGYCRLRRCLGHRGGRGRLRKCRPGGALFNQRFKRGMASTLF